MTAEEPMTGNKAISDLRKALLNWYSFDPDGRVLLLGEDTEPLTDLLSGFCRAVDHIPAGETVLPSFADGQYDYIVADDLSVTDSDRMRDHLRS